MASNFHATPEKFLNQRVSVALIGCGGNGCRMLTGLAELHTALIALGHPGGLDVTVFDPDTVSEANLARQPFAECDLGLHKAIVLTHRVNMFYQLDWTAMPQTYTSNDRKRSRYSEHDGSHFQLVISCVDTAKARRDIESAIELYFSSTYWLDLGNQQDSGQVVLGKHEGKARSLPTVMDLFPDLRFASFQEDNSPSCSIAEALGRQDLFVNRIISDWALQLLDNLFRKGGLQYHGYFINLADGIVAPIPVPDAMIEKKAVARNKRQKARAMAA